MQINKSSTRILFEIHKLLQTYRLRAAEQADGCVDGVHSHVQQGGAAALKRASDALERAPL